MAVGEWLEALAEPDAAMRRTLAELYGPDETLWAERTRLWRRALTDYGARFGNQPVIVSRAPARLSFNPHSDHQGSFVLYACHAREIVLVAGLGDEDLVWLINSDHEHADELGFEPAVEMDRDAEAWRAGWTAYIEAPAVKRSVEQMRDPKERLTGRTGSLNYVKAALLRLSKHAGRPLGGLNLCLAGDIPPGAGMSSSSAIVVATALAADALFGLGWEREALVPVLGEAEWYVGTRGGSGDHAAMLLGSRRELVNLAFEPPVGLREVRRCPWPEGARLLLANCGVRSEKSSAEKRLFNQGVFAYKFAFAALYAALTRRCDDAELVAQTHRLADFNVQRLPLELLCELLLDLPERATLGELRAAHGAGFDGLLQSFFDTTDASLLPADVPLRGAALYGLGRADRGLIQDRLLADGELAEFGALMTVTHDGDRRFRTSTAGELEPWTPHEDLRCDEPLRRCGGHYGASIAALDRLVDIALAQHGVLGAGLMGAGGGGVVQVLLGDEADAAAVTAALSAPDASGGYPAARVEPWRPVGGASVLQATS